MDSDDEQRARNEHELVTKTEERVDFGKELASAA
jgi:hypothetical protein